MAAHTLTPTAKVPVTPPPLNDIEKLSTLPPSQVMKEARTVTIIYKQSSLCPAVMQEAKQTHRKWRCQPVVMRNMILVCPLVGMRHPDPLHSLLH